MLNILTIIAQYMLYRGLLFCRFVDEDQYYNKMVNIIKNNGVVFVKMGQILSSRADNGGLPRVLIEKIRTMQDKCFYTDISTLRTVPGVEYSSLSPIAAGSICNIHQVTYAGRPAVIKSTHDNVQDYIDESIKTVKGLNIFSKYYYGYNIEKNIELDDYRQYIIDQLDLAKEAEYQTRMRELFRRFPQVHIPEVYLADRGYIVMEYLPEGLKYNDFIRVYPGHTMECISLLYAVILTMIQSGCIHGDLHFGNFTFRLVEGRVHINIFDFGIMLVLTPDQSAILQRAFDVLEPSSARVRHFIDFAYSFDPTMQEQLRGVDLEKHYTLNQVLTMEIDMTWPLPCVSFFMTLQSFLTILKCRSKAERTDIMCYMIENDFIEI